MTKVTGNLLPCDLCHSPELLTGMKLSGYETLISALSSDFHDHGSGGAATHPSTAAGIKPLKVGSFNVSGSLRVRTHGSEGGYLVGALYWL